MIWDNTNNSRNDLQQQHYSQTSSNKGKWTSPRGLKENALEITMNMDGVAGDYEREFEAYRRSCHLC